MSGIDEFIADIMTNKDKSNLIVEEIKEEEPKEEEKPTSPKPHGTRGKKSKRKGTGVKGGAPTVASKGGSGLRCYMRYGNAGQVYRICKGPPPPTTKPPAVFTPLITPEEFVRKLAKGNKKIKSYGDLSSSQKQNYHRLAMAQSRSRRRENREMNNDEYTLFLEQKRMDAQIDRVENRLQRKKEKEEKRVKRQFEERGILDNNPEEIKKYFRQKEEKEIKTQKSEKYKDEFFETRKDDINELFEKKDKLEDSRKKNIWLNGIEDKIVSRPRFEKNEKGEMKRKGNIYGPYTEKLITIKGVDKPYTPEGLVKDFKFDRQLVIYQLEKNPEEFVMKMKQLGTLIPKKLREQRQINKEEMAKLINAPFHKKILKPLRELSEPIKENIVKLYNQQIKEQRDNNIDNLKNKYKEHLEKERKSNKTINETKLTKTNYKNKQAVKDERNKGKTYKWVRQNVKLIFDKDFSGEAKVGDIGDMLMGVDEALETLEEVDEKLQDLQANQKKDRKKRQKKKKQLSEAQKEKIAKKEAKDLERLQRALKKINNQYK